MILGSLWAEPQEQTYVRERWVSLLFLCSLTNGDEVINQRRPSACRRLLALGRHRVSHPERQAPAPRRPTRTVLSGRLCWHLSLSGTLRRPSPCFVFVSVNKTGGRSRRPRRACAVFPCSSGSLANGWTL